MPADFLTDAQEQRYGRYAGDPNTAQLARFFYLDDADEALITQRRHEHTRLGFALQLCTVRFLGTFLTDPTDVPPSLASYIAGQLHIDDPTCLVRYRDSSTQWAHASEIRQHYGYHDFAEQPAHFRFIRWLYTRAWLSAERPSVLFDHATAYLVERKILLPGVTTLVRLVGQARDRAAERLWQRLAQQPTRTQREKLATLLQVPEGKRTTQLDQLRRPPTRISAVGLVGALKRLDAIRAFGAGSLTLDRLPPGRVAALARYAVQARAQAIARMPDDRRVATLVAFARAFEAHAQDDALDLFDQLLTKLLARSDRRGQQGRLRSLKDMDAAALQLQTVCQLLLDEIAHPDTTLRATIFAKVPRDQVQAAVDLVRTLARPPDADNYYENLATQYSMIRQFLPTLVRSIHFAGADAAAPVLAAVRYLEQLEGKRMPTLADAPQNVITAAWRRHVVSADTAIDRRFYTFCVLERLQDALSRRDVYVTPSERWANPRTKVLEGAAWNEVKSQVCRTLERSPVASVELDTLTKRLDATYRRVAENLPNNAAATIVSTEAGATFSLSKLDAVPVPASLTQLGQATDALFPRVDLPDILLDMHGYTGFADEFTHISERAARVDDLYMSVCAVLVAEACNIGLEPVIRPDVPALTRARLAWVQQNYIRAETITRANARLVDAQRRLPLAHVWGGGDVASADGLRFVVPIRTLNAGPNSKYFWAERGVTYYNFASDQYTGFHGFVIPGTVHEGPYLLAGLLEQQTSLRPLEVMADTAAYSDIIFALFWLLGYQFSPRLADIGEMRLWTIEGTPDYGPLTPLARHRINLSLISANWDDILRVVGSLHLGTVGVVELLRTMQGSGKLSTLARAIGELGRIIKTLYMLHYLDDEHYRRRILIQLNRGEGRHRLARVLFHGQRGELRQRYREGQEDQLGALGLVLNTIILWNTRYLDAALTHVRAEGTVVNDADVARLSPLGNAHIHVQGRYHFTMQEAARHGELRPLYSPDPTDFDLRNR